MNLNSKNYRQTYKIDKMVFAKFYKPFYYRITILTEYLALLKLRWKLRILEVIQNFEGKLLHSYGIHIAQIWIDYVFLPYLKVY